jgi:Zn finger protein HypA/HybF involved in hydrogenase expression
MHEHHLMKDLLADALRHARERGVTRITTLYLSLGGLTEIDPEILRHYLVEHARGTAAEGAELRIEPSPVRELRLLSFDGE